MSDRHQILADRHFWLRLEYELSGWFRTCGDNALGGYWWRPLANWERVAIGIAGMVAVLAPSGTLTWLVAMGISAAGLLAIGLTAKLAPRPAHVKQAGG